MKKMLFSIKGILTAMSAMLVLIVSLIASYETAPPADISLGANSGNMGPERTVDGLTEFSYSAFFVATSTSVCSIRTPSATTTLVDAVLRSTGAGNGSTITDALIAVAANTGASTTKIAGVEVSAGNQAFVRASSTAIDTVAGARYALGGFIAPDSYVNFAVIGTSSAATTGVVAGAGDCYLKLRNVSR